MTGRVLSVEVISSSDENELDRVVAGNVAFIWIKISPFAIGFNRRKIAPNTVGGRRLLSTCCYSILAILGCDVFQFKPSKNVAYGLIAFTTQEEKGNDKKIDFLPVHSCECRQNNWY